MVENTDLVRSLFDEDKTVRRRSGEALAKLGSTALVALLEEMLASPDHATRAAAVRAMGQFAAAPLIPLLERIAADPNPELAALAVASLDRQAARKKGTPPRAGKGRAGYSLQPAASSLSCPVCGDPAPATAYWCPNCHEQLRPDAEPHKPADFAGLADWNSRGCASLVDTGIAMLFSLATAFLPLFRGWGGAAYNLAKDGLNGGQSWGKAQYRLRVVDATTGEPATYMQSLARNVIFLFPPIAFLEIVLVMSTGVRLGDKIANTRVVGGDPNANVAYMLLRLCLLFLLVIGLFVAIVSGFAR